MKLIVFVAFLAVAVPSFGKVISDNLGDSIVSGDEKIDSIVTLNDEPLVSDGDEGKTKSRIARHNQIPFFYSGVEDPSWSSDGRLKRSHHVEAPAPFPLAMPHLPPPAPLFPQPAHVVQPAPQLALPLYLHAAPIQQPHAAVLPQTHAASSCQESSGSINHHDLISALPALLSLKQLLLQGKQHGLDHFGHFRSSQPVAMDPSYTGMFGYSSFPDSPYVEKPAIINPLTSTHVNN